MKNPHVQTVLSSGVPDAPGFGVAGWRTVYRAQARIVFASARYVLNCRAG